MYIAFKQEIISSLLPEKRPDSVFSNPDLFIVFNRAVRFVLWQEIIDELPEHWLAGKDLWDSDFDFSSNHCNTEHDTDCDDRVFDDYKTLELLQFPTLDTLDVEQKYAFAYDSNHVLHINQDFIKDLKSAGCSNIWYNTTAPFGRY
ncbi:hypothetical protein [Shewanella fidelis]|uniref:Uncharacterized protein n=1 Tax=Shewanella fidelis TaxID=173509 RepID=A0AAW8NIQ2_9GAMM|nr:hypothetical protein [Shewanella fidelis]MDR8522230.1 hypothetical protein [Shewanella fidelis]MDW4812554.1 hypothetical protein [Shewanella fidelis]MDW4816301.1 hypothetical protein [Shewanella fidelis]MDW4820795.1 hypothetical protein [Shewanella fidelis]MDW4825017.1 hypothetical protein [Shewanella fidelis]